MICYDVVPFLLGLAIYQGNLQAGKRDIRCLKGQCHQIFKHFFIFKESTCTPYEQAKKVSQTFLFLQRYSIAKFKNRMSAQSTTMQKGSFLIFKLLLFFLSFDDPLKSAGSLQSLLSVSAKSMSTVQSAQSTTFWHKSTQSTTALTQCQRVVK